MAYADGALLANDATLQGRVNVALVAACNNVVTEAITQANLQLHIVRARLAAQILLSLQAGQSGPWTKAFALVVGNDTTCQADATTQAGGALTAANTPAAAAAVTDAHMNNAIASMWNAFCTLA